MRFVGLLPLFLSSVPLFILVTRLCARQNPVRGRFLPFFLSAVSFATLTVILTETLSAFSALSPNALRNAWYVFAAVLVLFNLALSRFFPGRVSEPTVRKALLRSDVPSDLRIRLRARIGSVCSGAIPNDRLSGLLLAALLCLLLITLTVAIVYPPNNVDSINYHVARVMHWAQQGSVAYYPTAIMMQLQGAPLAEFFLLQVYLLTGTDLLLNLVQWSSLLLAAFAVYSAAELLLSRSGLAAAILAASLPMAVLQATSTQNDLVAASWLAVSVYLGLCVLRNPKAMLLLFFAALALGLAVLAKPTVFPIAAPFAIVFAWYLLTRRRQRFAVVLAAILVVLPSMPFYIRNLVFWGFGSPYGPTWGLSNDRVSVVGVISNLIRNVALHSQFPLSGAAFDAFNSGALGTLRMFHETLGVPIDDLRFSLIKANAFQPNVVFHEDGAGDPLHLILFLTFLPVVVVEAFRKASGFREARGRVVARRAGALMLCTVGGFVALSGYLKWQPFGSRLDLPLFVAACIPLGVLVGGLPRMIRGVLLTGCLAYAFTAVCLNATRPVSPPLAATRFDRRAAYFASRKDLLEPYIGITKAIKMAGCHEVGYRIGRDPFEYPLWVLLGEGGYRFRFEHVEFGHPSRRLQEKAFEPCAVISPDALADYELAFEDVRVGSYHAYIKRGRP